MGIFGLVGPRYVRSSDEFDEQCRVASARFNRFQAVFGEVRKRLAHTPEVGKAIPSTPGLFYVANPAVPIYGVPQIVILYSFDPTTLLLLKLRAG